MGQNQREQIVLFQLLLMVGSDDEQQDEQHEETSSSISPEPVRRSTRDRKPPAWRQSGQFDLSKSVG